jgi:hypothetical protein
MLRQSTMLALAAIAALGLAISNASAKPVGPGNIGKGQGIGSPGIIKQAGGIKIIPSNPIKPKPPGVNWPLYPKPGKPVHWPIKPVYHPIYKPVPVVVSRPVYVAARPVSYTPGPCTCLSKEYTSQGAVVFKDRCTAEMAMNPPVVTQ